MTDCPNGEIRDLLPELLHDRLAPAERARVERHVASCADCADELALLRDLRATMRRAPVVDIGAIAAAIPAHRAPARRSFGGWRNAAAIAAIAVGGTSIALINRQAPAPRAETQAQAPVANVPARATAERPTPAPDSAPTQAPDVAHPPVTPAPAPRGAESQTVALTGAAAGELSDRELATLVDELESLDAVPSEEVESPGTISYAAPSGSIR